MKKYAIADIGSNTIKMSIFSEDGILLRKELCPAGLIGYVKDRLLSDRGLDVLTETLLAFSEIAEKEEAGPLYPFATASLRAADNADAVIEAIERRVGCRIELVSGEEEAALSLAGIGFASKEKIPNGTLLDMGGGSCEILSFCNDIVTQEPVSLPVGALLLFRNFVRNILPERSELEAIDRYVRTLAAENGISPRKGALLAVGGTIRALASFHAECFGKKVVFPYTMRHSELEEMRLRILEKKNETKLAMLRLFPTRIHTVPTGLCAHLALMELLDSEAITVVNGGAREGYFLKIKAKREKEESQ